MKLTKKKVFVSALALCLVAILSMGSLAWFSAKDEVTNKFLIADSEDDTPDKIFSVSVWEKTPDTDKDEDGHTYKDILPGDTLKKEVHVENTGHYKQYIRVIVTVTDASAWQKVFGLTGGQVVPLSNIVANYDATIWQPSGANYDATNNTFVYVLYYNGILESGKDITVFTDVKIPESLTREQAADFRGGFEVKVKAQAVQTENVGSSAYEAFQTVGMAIDG